MNRPKLVAFSCSDMAGQSQWKGWSSSKTAMDPEDHLLGLTINYSPFSRRSVVFSWPPHMATSVTFLLILYSTQPSQYFTSETLKKHHFQPQIQLQMSQLSSRNGDMPFLFHFCFFLSTHCILKYSCGLGSLVQMM